MEATRDTRKRKTLAMKLAARPEGVTAEEMRVEEGSSCRRNIAFCLRQLWRAGQLQRERFRDSGRRGSPPDVYHVSDPAAAIALRRQQGELVHRLTERNDDSLDRLRRIIPVFVELTGVTAETVAKITTLPESFVDEALGKGQKARKRKKAS
jgi:hypothetical protein